MAAQTAGQPLDPQLMLHLRASKYYMLASVVILFFDHFLTFDLEVRNLWRKRWTGPTLLFVMNRYYPMLVYVVVLISVYDPSWSAERRFPLLATLGSEAIIGMIIMLRLYALHTKHTSIICLLAPLYLAQLSLGGWAADAVLPAIGLPPGSGCIISVPKEFAQRFAWLWGSSALFDTIVFGLTMYRVVPLRRTGLKLPLTTLFFRDGIVYFAVMFSARLLNFILFWTAVTVCVIFSYAVTSLTPANQPDLVPLNWTFNNTITVIMVNRLVLNLRRESSKDVFVSRDTNHSASHNQKEQFMSTFTTELCGDISSESETEMDSFESLEEKYVEDHPREIDTFRCMEEGEGRYI